MADDLDITIPLLPFDADAPDAPRPTTLSAGDFKYIGTPLTGEAFRAYVQGYDFGSILPSYLVLHNTANPDASWAPLNSDPAIKWDRSEGGLNEAQIKGKRKAQLDAIMRYYVSLGWTTGPHLFIDDRWIWLFTPMYEIGTHAKSGNSYHDASGALHYSVGIETVGYFEHAGWPAPMQKLLQVAVQSLRDRLHTFEIVYKAGPLNTPAAHDHSISFHRDFNKPGCPGGIITPEYAIPILQTPYAAPYLRYRIVAPCAVLTSRAPDSPLATGPDDGQTHLAPGDVVNVGDTQGGWLWVSDGPNTPPGIGFVPASYARPV